MPVTVSSIVRRLAAFAVATAAAASALAQSPVTVTEYIKPAPNPVRGWIAVVDLTSNRVDFRVTDPAPAGTANESILTTTTSWRTTTGVRLAINANFYAVASPSSQADIVGLAMSQGQIVSPPRLFNGVPDPAITFTASRQASIGNFSSSQLTGVYNAIAGVGPSTTDTDPGTLLVTNGVNTGATARVDPNGLNARTGIGVNQAGTRLYIIVVDGGQSNWSVGMTLPQFADLFIQQGAWRAINLDGGGSSSFVFVQDNGTTVQNRPSNAGNAFRAVANHFGIHIYPAASDRTIRPIRGAWLRPPSTLTGGPSSFEGVVSAVAGAGIQDLYLETLYWGRDTAGNNLASFPSRFGFDYLAQAIPLAARYGVRVHAWCETGYLDFGTSPSPLLAANPSWVVKHRDPSNTITGDLADQRFVNLGNPGVRTALAQYMTATATNYPALESVQADYHFFPLAPSNAAPWSVDPWAISAYQATYGVSPLSDLNTAGTSYPARWLTWNRNNVTQALVILKNAVKTASPTMNFSAVAFADWSSSIHTSKMIDLPAWGTTSAADQYFIMSYFAALSSIDTDIGRGISALPGKRLVVGLANLTNQTRPQVTDQLSAVRRRGLDDFAWFEANTLAGLPQMQTAVRNWIRHSTVPIRGDIDLNGFVDARDRVTFFQVYSGSPIPVSPGLERYDLNASNVIDESDALLFEDAFRRNRFGDDGVVDGRDLAALRACFTNLPNPNPAILNRWDLSGDGIVNYDDQLVLHGFLTVQLPPDVDVNSDGAADLNDLYTQVALQNRDVNRDGVIDLADVVALEAALRTGEVQGMVGSQR
jgi:uncharacterized lipoprotein YddW (UPF0748 family)